MADPLFITQLDPGNIFKNTDYIIVEQNPGGTPETVYFPLADFIDNMRVRQIYQISRTISGNNLVIAIKDAEGNDATADKPLYFNNQGATNKLTGALSLTVNAGADVFGYGTTSFANLVEELFVYVGKRASDSSIFVAASRIPYARVWSEFSATTTNERYAAYSGSAPGANDQVQNIGRINIMNSGTPSFNWYLPAGPITLNFPVFLTSWLDWNPTHVGFSVAPSGSVYRYRLDWMTAELFVRQTANGTSNAANFTISLPMTARTITNMAWGGAGLAFDNGVVLSGPAALRVITAATVLEVLDDWTGSASWTTSGGKRLAQMNPFRYEYGV